MREARPVESSASFPRWLRGGLGGQLRDPLDDRAVILAAGLTEKGAQEARPTLERAQRSKEWRDLEFQAEALLRHFARRLPGFADSALGHVVQSFLSGLGEVRLAGEDIHVRLPESPLRLVLKMTGVGEDRFAPPWLGGRTVHLILPP
jgi:hypothetical protein